MSPPSWTRPTPAAPVRVITEPRAEPRVARQLPTSSALHMVVYVPALPSQFTPWSPSHCTHLSTLCVCASLPRRFIGIIFLDCTHVR